MWKTEKSLKYMRKSKKNHSCKWHHRKIKDEAQIVFEEIVAGKRYQIIYSEVLKTTRETFRKLY